MRGELSSSYKGRLLCLDAWSTKRLQ